MKELDQIAKDWADVLQYKFRQWLLEERRVKQWERKKDGLEKLRADFPDAWENFYKAGLGGTLRTLDKRIGKMLQLVPDNERPDPTKRTRWDRNTFVDGKPPKR